MENWIFDDGCSELEGGEIEVLNSEKGCIYKAGLDWDNYIVTFKTKIVNQLSGWIIRALDLDHYILIQCGADKIIRAIPRSGDWFVDDEFSGKSDSEVDDWFSVRIDVIGRQIKVFINDSYSPSFNHRVDFFEKYNLPLKGTIGFRCAHNPAIEDALFKDIRIQPINTVDNIENVIIDLKPSYTTNKHISYKSKLIFKIENKSDTLLEINNPVFMPKAEIVQKKWCVPTVSPGQGSKNYPKEIKPGSELKIYVPLAGDYSENDVMKRKIDNLLGMRRGGEFMLECYVGNEFKILKIDV